MESLQAVADLCGGEEPAYSATPEVFTMKRVVSARKRDAVAPVFNFVGGISQNGGELQRESSRVASKNENALQRYAVRLTNCERDER
jgi:hypothetical protein